MLVIGRKTEESIILRLPTGETVTVLIVRVQGETVQVGIDAPGSVPVFRRELLTHNPK